MPFTFLLFTFYSYAETTPSSGEAGIIEEKIKQDGKKEGLRQEAPVPLPQIEDQRPSSELTLEDISGKILVKKFVLNGVTRFQSVDFVEILQKYKDAHVGITELNEVAGLIQNFYRQKGYITSFAYVPVQKIENNTVEIRVVEGCVGNISVDGAKYFNPEDIRKKAKLYAGEIILYKNLMQRLKKINRHPDLSVKAVLLPGEKAETTDVALKVTDNLPKHIYLGFDNRGTKYTGKSRFNTSYVDNNFLGHEDIFSVKYLQSNEHLYSGSVDYNFPLNTNDTRLGVYGSYVKVEVGREFSAVDAKGKAATGGLYLNHPLWDEEYSRGNLSFGLDFKRNKNYILNTVSSDDELSVVKCGLSLNKDDSLGATFLTGEAHSGIAHFAGSMDKIDPKASRLGAGGEFLKYKVSGLRRQNLPFSAFLLLSAKSQYTEDKLVSCEQFYIGGADTVRGYPELEFMGDYGYNASAELRTPAYLLPRRLWNKIQLAYFVDYGWVYLKEPLAGQRRDESLLGAGLGLRLTPWKNWQIKLDWGFPLDPAASDSSQSRVNIWANVELF